MFTSRYRAIFKLALVNGRGIAETAAMRDTAKGSDSWAVSFVNGQTRLYEGVDPATSHKILSTANKGDGLHRCLVSQAKLKYKPLELSAISFITERTELFC